MAEHDSDREDREGREGREGREAREPDRQEVPFDEDAAWRAIVAGYGEEPPDPPGARPFKSVEDLALLEKKPEKNPVPDAKDAAPDAAKDPVPDAESVPGGDAEDSAGRPAARPLGGSVAFAPGVGPRDYTAPEPSDDDFDADDEGHFVPPEPPPLPTADTTAKFAWLGVIGGPVLLLLAVLLGWDMTWWLSTLGIGGFLGGFVTLVTRMRTDDDEDDDPGRGAVV
ncbi:MULTISPECIES: hypothetical protein [Streptomyces]|uniref:DUF308 domain-containing protein n=1 Tax=Streptomyces bangladeshensis TaxID=295352 RepID=A0ABN3BCA5_9ACTN|nr:hypothetical protein [Streptomyces sp. FBKL.4005]OYP18071.1 hypothetical protein CFC35_29225 [Streptomyces sp. FBKL.4005]